MRHTPFFGFDDCVDLRTQAAIDAGHPEWVELPAKAGDAKALGVTHFFTGKPCKHGHVDRRAAVNGCCAECHRAFDAEYRKYPAVQKRLREYKAERRKDPKAWAAHVECSSTRRATKKNATPPWVDRKKIKAAFRKASRLTKLTGIKHHVDHIVPLTHPNICGLHIPDNLQPLTERENLVKGNSFDGTLENESWRERL